MKTVFVSGCFDILHAGHLKFFHDARSLGDHLTVCFASQDSLLSHKQRLPSIPDEHKKLLLESLKMVDSVVVGTGSKIGFDFEDHFRALQPNILAITTDSCFRDEKAKLCAENNAELVILEKSPPTFEPISTSQIVQNIKAPIEAPLRVDFAGGWLDVPKHAIQGEFIVNCAISPMVSKYAWNYEKQSGLGGSGAWAMLNGKNSVKSELELGVGWQDPAVIHETGCCVWRSGPMPELDFKRNGDFLQGLMAIAWTGQEHDTPSIVDHQRDYQQIARSSQIARKGVLRADISQIAKGMSIYYDSQIAEGMLPLPEASGALAWKYCGGGYGGYALYLFPSEPHRADWVASCSSRQAIEPYCK